MGRRSIHTPDELRELIIEATTSIVEHDGLEGLSAREIAKRVGYSPGTLYNVFENLDDLLLIIEARLLDELAERLADTDASGPPAERLRRLVGTYFVFTQERPKLWNLLNEHRMPAGREVPEWYQVKVENLLVPLEEALDAIARRRRHGAPKRARAHAVGECARNDLAIDGGQALARHRACRALAGRRSRLDLPCRSAAALRGTERAVARRARTELRAAACRRLALPEPTGNEPVVVRIGAAGAAAQPAALDRDSEPPCHAAAGAAAATPTSDAR